MGADETEQGTILTGKGKEKMNGKKRLGIFCMYDKDGMVGKYIQVYLENILPYLTELVIVCNGGLAVEGENILRNYARQIYVREDKGMDGGAFQDAILNILGIDYVREYDELLLLNDTMYGPFESWEPVFRKMEAIETDFWGLSRSVSKNIPLHLQAYFVIFRKKILHSKDFEEFWRNLDAGELDKNRVVANYEINLTCFLEGRGYTWSSYSQCTDKNMFSNPYYFLAQEKLPVLKANVFSSWGDSITTDEERENVQSYIRNHTDYEFDMIADNIKRKEGRDVYKIKCRKAKGAPAGEEIISWHDVASYATRYTECYLYGNTLKTYILRNILKPGQIKGIVVSDEFVQEGNQELGIPLYKFSEVENHGEGLVVTLGYKNSKMLKDDIVKKFPQALFYWDI